MPARPDPLPVAVDASWFGPAQRGMASHACALVDTPLVAPILLNHPRSAPQPVFEQALFARRALRSGAVALLAPYNTAPLGSAGRLVRVAVVHDLIFLDPLPGGGLPSWRQRAGRSYRRWVVPAAARRSDVIVTVSGAMRECIAERLGVDRARIHVVPNTADAALYEPYVFRATAGPVRLLAVSGTAPNKNLPRLLRAVARAADAGEPLAADVVGVAPADGAALVARLGLRAPVGRFTFQRGISRERLHALYRGADVFVMASLAEGFGIPLLEALAAGLRCVASDLPIFREIAGADATYVDPLREEDLARAVADLARLAIGQRGEAVTRRPAASAARYAPAAIRAAVDALWTRVAGLCGRPA